MNPNVLVTGTPGCGKTTLCEQVAKASGFIHLNVSELVKEHELHNGRDEQFDTLILDDDKVCDMLEPLLEKGGVLVDFHSSELFPERWFDLVIVLRTDTDVLYNRLESRGYNERKINENIEAEIMQVCLDEAMASYDPEIVHEIASNSPEQCTKNVQHIVAWIKSQEEEN